RGVETLAGRESEDSGKPLSQARNDARVCARYFRFYSHVIESYYGLSIPLRPDLHVYTRREPLVVTGLAPEAGAALAAHPDVDHLSFVGSTELGSLIAGAAAKRVAPVTLELGGKSAHLIFGDAGVERAAAPAATLLLQNAGQTCSAGSRLLVDERVHDQVLERIVG